MKTGERLAVVGGGNMGEALLRGLLAAKLVAPEDVWISDVREDRLAFLRETYHVRTTTSNAEAAQQAKIVLLAVKPQVMADVLEGLQKAITEDKLIISIAGGIPTTFISGRFSHPVRVVRVMPNTPALVLEGMSALAGGAHATAEDVKLVTHLFEAVGKVVVLDEAHLDAVTGLSGSGPAYAFLVIEALADGGVKMGLSWEVALALAAQTVRGAARMVQETGKHPGQLKNMVTSPAGTTIAGLHALEQAGLRAACMNAVEAATRRSRELGKQ